MPLVNSNQHACMYVPQARPTSPPHALPAKDDALNKSSNNNHELLFAEQLLVSHLHFAHALRKNDAAMILQYLGKDVTLLSMDGAHHEGQSAVLAHLVGARMTKLSANLHIKGCPSRSGECQSTFIYEHGIVFKDPLFMEVLDWKPQDATIVRITHFSLTSAKNGKTPHELCRSMPLRLSLGMQLPDDDPSEAKEDSDSETSEVENNSNSLSGPVKVRSRRFKSNSSAETSNAVVAAVTATSLRRSSSSGSNRSGGYDAAILPFTLGPVISNGTRKPVPVLTLIEITCRGLTPIRKRKTVNSFVLLRCPVTGSVWKSPIVRRNPNPNWNHFRFKIFAQNVADVVEISLWDHTFFRSVKVAEAALVVSDLLRSSTDSSTTIQLERTDAARGAGEPQHVLMKLRFLIPGGGDSIPRSSDEADQNSTKDETESSQSDVTITSSSTLRLKLLALYPFGNSNDTSLLLMLVPAAIFVAFVWILFQVQSVWPFISES